MNVRIKETGKIKRLYIAKNGIEYTADFMNSPSELKYNSETGEYEMDNADFQWWYSVLHTHNYIEEICEAIKDDFDAEDQEELLTSIQDTIGYNDLDTFSKKSFTVFVNDLLEPYNKTVKIYNDGSIGFDSIE
jgi:hypothetical protein